MSVQALRRHCPSPHYNSYYPTPKPLFAVSKPTKSVQLLGPERYRFPSKVGSSGLQGSCLLNLGCMFVCPCLCIDCIAWRVQLTNIKALRISVIRAADLGKGSGVRIQGLEGPSTQQSGALPFRGKHILSLEPGSFST